MKVWLKISKNLSDTRKEEGFTNNMRYHSPNFFYIIIASGQVEY